MNNKTTLPRGLRNNNPGNIRHSDDKWQGMSAKQTDTKFVQFTTIVYGYRALAKLLINYKKKYKLNTVEGIISRWAPASDNNYTKGYIKTVADALMVSPIQMIDVEDEGTLVTICAAISRVENGRTAVMQDVKAGVKKALTKQ